MAELFPLKVCPFTFTQFHARIIQLSSDEVGGWSNKVASSLVRTQINRSPVA